MLGHTVPYCIFFVVFLIKSGERCEGDLPERMADGTDRLSEWHGKLLGNTEFALQSYLDPRNLALRLKPSTNELCDRIPNLGLARGLYETLLHVHRSNNTAVQY